MDEFVRCADENGRKLDGTMTKITAFITCYNREGRVGDAVRSALEQDFPPSEVLIVDDGSTDGSAEVLRSFGSRVRVIRTPNRGFSLALNRGLAEATGDWIAFLDSDDVWKPNKLRRQVEAIRAFPAADLVFCDMEVVRAGAIEIPSRFALGGVYGSEQVREGSLLHFDRSLFVPMLSSSRVFTSAVMARRTLPGLRFREDFRCCTDWPTWLKLVLDHEFAAVDEVLLRMHYDGDNLTSRVGRILRNNVIVLRDLLNNARLTDRERTAVAEQLSQTRVGAMYHSLVEGESRAARQLLWEIPPRSLPAARWPLYWLATWMPGPALRWLARVRGGRSEMAPSAVQTA